MRKFFEKHETISCIILIVLYVLINSFCMQNFGLTDYRSVIFNTVFSLLLVALIIHLKRWSYYGLTKVTNLKDYLHFVPLILIVSVNLWGGFNINSSMSEIICYMLSMINVGFLEEIIFRGFLFRMMEKDNVKNAMIVSSITFGMGHIINLFIGADLVTTLLQICYATAIGFLFVIIFMKSKSLVPCIVTHCLVNSLSIFNGKNDKLFYVESIFLIIVPVVYAWYINKNIKE